MGRNNTDFQEGKNHIVNWTGESGAMYEQKFPTAELLPEVDKQKAVGKHLAEYKATENHEGNEVEGPAKGSKVKWTAVD